MKKIKQIQEYVYITLGTFICSAAVFFFMMPSHLSLGSVSGLAVLLNQVTGVSVSALSMGLNVILLIVGFIMLGKEFGIKTIYTSILFPVFLALWEYGFPEFDSITGDAFVDMVLYCFSVSVGQAMLFNRNASSGGLDIIAKILNKYLRVDLGKALAIPGMCVAVSAIFVYDLKTVVLSVLGTYVCGLVLDHFIFGSTMKKRVCIISEKEKEIRDFVLHTLHSGATLYHAYGAYDEKKRDELIVIVNKQEYVKLMNFLTETDPDAFITIYSVSEVLYRPKTQKRS